MTDTATPKPREGDEVSEPAPTGLVTGQPETQPEGRYDVRAGAAAFAPIIGAFGALSVAAIVVVFTYPVAHRPHSGTYTALATGLLVIGMFGSLLGSLGLAAIGAETAPTANLAPATMLIAVPVSISVAAILAAFQVLAALYDPESTALFTYILIGGGLFGVLFTAFAVGDSYWLGPSDPDRRKEYLRHQWLRDPRRSYRAANIVGVTGSVPIVAAMVLRLAGQHANPTRTETNWLVGAGILLTLVGTLCSLFRTSHDPSGAQHGLRHYEAYGTVLSVGIYVLVMTYMLP